jgi:hypothetical protein
MISPVRQENKTKGKIISPFLFSFYKMVGGKIEY